MKAFVIERYGKDELQAGEVPEPEPRDSDVLVRVRAALHVDGPGLGVRHRTVRPAA